MTVLEGPASVADAAASWVADALRDGAHTLVLAGGSTFTPAYERLAQKHVEWGRVTVLFGDERCVPPTDADSNYATARKALLDHVSPASVHRIPAELGPRAGADEYERVIAAVGPLDLVLLGVGPDGHTASLFPGAPAVESNRLVEGVQSAPKPPPERVTLTLPAFREAKRVLMVATGADKAEAVARAQRGEVPAGMVDGAEWLLDRAAAAELQAPSR